MLLDPEVPGSQRGSGERVSVSWVFGFLSQENYHSPRNHLIFGLGTGWRSWILIRRSERLRPRLSFSFPGSRAQDYSW